MSNELKTLLGFYGLDRLSAVNERLGKTFDPLIQKAQALTSAYNDVNTKTEKFAKSMKKVGEGVTSAGKALSVGITAPLTVLGGLAIHAGIELDEAMEGLQIRADLSGEALHNVGEELKTLVTGSKFTATQAVGALTNLLKFNFKLEESYKLLPNIIDLATAAQLDLGDAAKITAGVLRSYNLKITDAARVNDLLVRTSNVANTDLTQLSEAFREAGPMASSMGLSIEDTTAILSQFALKNIQGAEAGSLLTKAIAKIIEPSSKAKSVIRDVLHIDPHTFIGSQGKLKSFTGFLDQLQKKGATTGQILEIFGNKLGPKLAPLIAQGSDGIKEFTDKISGPNSLGAAAKTAGIRLEGPADSIERLKAAFNGLLIAISDSGLLHAFEGLVLTATNFFIWLKQLNPAVIKFAVVAGVLAAALGPVLIAVGTILTMLPAMLLGFSIMLPLLPAIAGAALTTTGVILALGFAFRKVYLLSKLVADNWELLPQIASLVWGDIKNVFSAGVDFILGLLKKVADFYSFGLFSKALDMASGLKLGDSTGKGQAVGEQMTNQNVSRTNNATVSVDFSNMPRGTNVSSKADAGLGLDLGLGFGSALQ